MMGRFMWWVPYAIVITAFCGLVEVSVQQSYRQGANDPQIQLSEDLALSLANGAKVETLVPQTKVDIAYSLSPFVMVYDNNGVLVASNATLNGDRIVIPPGVIEYTKQNQQDKVTWQPAPNVRSALVVTEYTGGFVAVGRSLREVEKREAALTQVVFLVWALASGGTFIFFAVAPQKKRTH